MEGPWLLLIVEIFVTSICYFTFLLLLFGILTAFTRAFATCNLDCVWYERFLLSQLVASDMWDFCHYSWLPVVYIAIVASINCFSYVKSLLSQSVISSTWDVCCHIWLPSAREIFVALVCYLSLSPLVRDIFVASVCHLSRSALLYWTSSHCYMGNYFSYMSIIRLRTKACTMEAILNFFRYLNYARRSLWPKIKATTKIVIILT